MAFQMEEIEKQSGCQAVIFSAFLHYLHPVYSIMVPLSTLQVKTILVAMVTKILELGTKLEPKSPAW